MKIIEPNKKYLLSYYDACQETWGHVHNDYILHNPEDFEIWQNTIFEDYKNQEKGIMLPHGFVPSKTFWIIDNENYIGTINIRLKLNDTLKKYGGHAGIVIRLSKRKNGYGEKTFPFIFDEVKNIGEKYLLLTCEEDNISSIKLIEKFSPDKLEKDEVLLDNRLTKIRRYYWDF